MANFLQDALPTIGGIGGGILGGIGGAVAAPFTGGVINPIDGAIAGAGLGGGAGQAIKNMTMGQDALQGNVLESAGSNALGQATGEGLGIVGKGLLGMLGRGAENGAGKLLQGQFSKGLIDNGTVGTLRDMGVTDANQINRLSPLVTGRNGAIANGVSRGLGESNLGADLSTLGTRAQQLIGENQMQLAGNSIPDVSNTVQKALLSALNSPEDVVRVAGKGGASTIFPDPTALKNILPENAFQVAQNFEQLANKAYQSAFDKTGAVINPDQLAKFKVFSGLAEDAKHAAFGGNTALPISDMNRAQIIAELAPMKAVNPDAYNYFVNKVSGAQNLQDLRPIQKPMVDASRALSGTLKASAKSGGASAGDLLGAGMATAGLATAGPAGAIPGVVTMLANHPAAGKIGTSVLSRVGDILTNPTLQKAVQKTLPVATTAAANVPGYSLDTPQGGATTMPQAMPLAGGATPATTASPEALQMMMGLIGLQSDPYMADSFVPMITGATQPLQQAGAAQSALRGLEGTYNQAGGGAGGFSGILARLQSLLPGTTGSLYNNQASQLQQTLQKLGIPNTAMPSLLSGSDTSNAGFGALQQIINSLGGNPASVLSTVPGA